MGFESRALGFFGAFLAIGLVFALMASAISAVTTDSQVSSALSANATVRVIVVMKTAPAQTSGGGRALASASSAPIRALDSSSGLNVTRRYVSFPLAAATVDSDGLAALQSNPDVAGVYLDHEVHAMDATSNAQIKADLVQNFVFSGQNVTGRNQTICIIDTGIDYRNAAFGSCSSVGSGGACRVVGGYNTNNNTADPMDDHGHGSHVSGIAGANGSGFTGVAPGVNFVALKALDSSGSGSDSNVVSAIDWCVSNRSVFNITVISMSLGDNTKALSACDSSFVADKTAINSAVAAGIFVAVASGNNFSSVAGVSSPGCLTNSTAVGAVDSSDAVASFSQTWNNYLLLTPGVSINSVLKNNNTGVLSGTSMATPHVAGVVALLQDFAQRANGTLASVTYLRNLLNYTGLQVTDARTGASFVNHSRVDALAALQAFQADVSPRNLSNASFGNGSSVGVSYAFVNVSFADDNATPSACVLQWSNGTLTNFSMAIANGSCSVNVTGQSNVNATFRTFINDSFGNVGSAFFAQSLDTAAPQTVNSTFANNSVLANASVLVNVSFSDLNPDSCILQLDGSNVTAKSAAGSCVFNRTVSEGTHNFTAFGNDSFGRLNQSAWYSFSTDTTFPAALSLLSPSSNNSNTTANYTFVNVSFSEAHPNNCILQYDNTSGVVNYTMALVGSNGVNPYCSLNVTSNFTVAAGQTHAFRVFVNDTTGNLNSTGLFSITHDSVRPSALSLVSPAANNSNTSANYTFVNFTFVEAHPSNCILEYANATGTANYSMALVGSNGVNPYCSFNVTSNFTAASSQTHHFTVWANDSAGNLNSSGVFSLTHDSVAPSALAFVVPTPANASFLAQDYLFVNLTFTESNPSACVVQLNGTANYSMALAGSGTSWACSANLTGLSQGAYNYSVFANDSSGLWSASALRSVTLDHTAPTVTVVSVSPLVVNRSSALFVTANATDAFSSVLNVSLAVQNASGVQAWSQTASKSGTNYSIVFSNLSGLADGNYSLNVTAVDNASNAVSNSTLNVTLDSTAPAIPVLSGVVNVSGFALLNWSGGADSVAFDHFELLRNGTLLQSGTGTNYSDSAMAFGLTYNYTVLSYDRAGNAALSGSVLLSSNDTILPRQSTNLTATNLANGTVNLSWSNVTLDLAGVLERNVTFRIFRTTNTSSTNVSNMTELGNASNLYFSDGSVLSASSAYLYVVAVLDGNGNFNSTVMASNSVNQTTVTACSNSFSDFSSCSGGSQSRTRTCLGVIETQSQSCSSNSGGSGGSGGGSGGSAGVSSGGGGVSSGGGGSSSPSSSGAHGGGGGGGGSSSNQLFVVQNIPEALSLEPGKSTSVPGTVSSFYTGYLRVNGVSITGVPSDWYDLPDLSIVTPISKTNFSIQWHPPAEARGNYTVRLDIVGVGTKNAGLLNTSFNFTLVLPPAETVKSSNDGNGARALPLEGTTPLSPVTPAPAPARSGGLGYGLLLAGLLLAVGLAYIAYARWKRIGAESGVSRPVDHGAVGNPSARNKSAKTAVGPVSDEPPKNGGLPQVDEAAGRGVPLPKKGK